MAGEWTTVPLSTIATVKSGKRLPLGQTLTSQRTAHPYVRLVDIDGNRIRKENMQYLEPSTQKVISRYIVRSGDVCLAIVGHTIGLVFQVEDEWDGANLTENAARLTDFRGADPAFVFSYLRSQLGQDLIKSRTVGSAQGKLPLYAIASFPIPLPPLAEQKAIAAVLGALDDKIELNRRMNATLQAMARAMFQSWFVDFDPVRAKLDGRHPAGMNAEVAALFPKALAHQDGELIPDGWRLITTEEVLSDDRGISVGVMYPGDHDPCGVPLIKAGDLSGGRINRNPPFRISHQKHAEYRRTEFSGGEILMTLVGNIGQCAVVPPEMKGWNSARAVAVIRLANATNANYVRLWLESPPIQFLMHAWSNTTVQETLNLTEIRKLPLLWPPKYVLEAFSNIVSPWLEQVENNYRQSETLATLRDTLLPKLLSGELHAPCVDLPTRGTT